MSRTPVTGGGGVTVGVTAVTTGTGAVTATSGVLDAAGGGNVITTAYVSAPVYRVPVGGTLTIANSAGTAAAVFTAATQSLKFVDSAGTVGTPSGGATICAGTTINGNTGTGTMVSHGSNYAVHRFGPKGQGTIGSQNATGGFDRAYVSTTTAAVTPIATLSIQSGSSTVLTGMLSGRNISTGATVYARIVGAAKNIAGTTTLVGTPVAVVDVTEIATAAFTMTASDGADTLSINVADAGGASIDWQCDFNWHDN